MKIKFKSFVSASHREAFELLDRELFEYLLPPGVRLVSFEGSSIGSHVHVQFTFPVKQDWISKIIEMRQENDQSYFVDIGEKLPFGIRQWRHKHIVKTASKGAYIIDDIYFTSQSKLLDILLFPVLWLSFLPRKWQYKSFIKHKRINQLPMEA